MNITNVKAIFHKQIKDTWKNKEVLIQFVMFPVLTFIMENSISSKDIPDHYFVTLFATMYIGMAPLTSMAAIIAEEKEKNTLRVLLMSNVKSGEYLIGVGSYIWLICMVGASVMGMVGPYRGMEYIKFIGIMCIGIIISTLMGAAIGTYSRNQMSATSLSVPLMLVFSFLPMISMFNPVVKKISRFTYSQQLNNLMESITESGISGEAIAVIALNMVVVLGLFTLSYRKRGMI